MIGDTMMPGSYPTRISVLCIWLFLDRLHNVGTSLCITAAAS